MNGIDVTNAGDSSGERPGDLHRECTDAPGRAVDQDFLPRLNVSFVAKALQGGERRHGYGGCLLERDILRLQDEC